MSGSWAARPLQPLRSLPSPHFDVEVIDVLPGPERLIQANRGPVAPVGLDIDDTGPKLLGKAPERLDEPGGYAFAAVGFRNRQVIDVHLAPLLFEFLQHVGGQPPDHSARVKRRKRDEMRLAQQRPQIVIAGHGALIRLRILEGLTEDPEHPLEQPHVMDVQPSV